MPNLLRLRLCVWPRVLLAGCVCVSQLLFSHAPRHHVLCSLVLFHEICAGQVSGAIYALFSAKSLATCSDLKCVGTVSPYIKGATRPSADRVSVFQAHCFLWATGKIYDHVPAIFTGDREVRPIYSNWSLSPSIFSRDGRTS